MKKHQKEIIKLTAQEVLLRIFDLATPFFEADHVYCISARKYKEHRDYEKSCFAEKIKYLKRRGLIDSFVEGKERFVEITPQGLDKIRKNEVNHIKIDRPEKWDGKWRLTIFDIPDKYKNSRDSLRYKLLRLGFCKIQESVYAYPFECSDEIRQLSESLLIENYVLIMISEIIQGEDSIIEKFLNAKVLTQEDLMVNKKDKNK